MDQRQRLKRKRMIRQKKMAGNAEYAYFDYGLVAVLIFLICFGLIMLYSTSYYSAQIDYKGDGAFYFRRQLLFSGEPFGHVCSDEGGLSSLHTVCNDPLCRFLHPDGSGADAVGG